jgi:hypothetical protein
MDYKLSATQSYIIDGLSREQANLDRALAANNAAITELAALLHQGEGRATFVLENGAYLLRAVLPPEKEAPAPTPLGEISV